MAARKIATEGIVSPAAKTWCVGRDPLLGKLTLAPALLRRAAHSAWPYGTHSFTVQVYGVMLLNSWSSWLLIQFTNSKLPEAMLRLS